MLIICNGAFKSGSSWLHAIVVELTKLRKLNVVETPQKYTNDINSPGTIIESRLQQFINNEDYIAENYLTKSHFFRESTLRKYYSTDVRILFIERDMRDAIVSHFFHIRNKYRVSLNFSIYYYLLGRYKSYEIMLFNSRCVEYMGKNNFFHFSDLKNNFEETVTDIALAIGITNLTSEELVWLKKETSIEKLRSELRNGNSKYYPSKRKDNWRLFREGKVGEWKNYFSDYQLRDITKIERGTFSFLSKLIYFLVFTLRRIVFSIE